MQIDNILENKKVAKHQTYLNMKDAFEYSVSKFGLEIDDIVSMSYNHRSHAKYDKAREQKMEKYRSMLDYDQGQVIVGLSNMFKSIQEYREHMRKFSLLDQEGYLSKFDIFKKAIRDTKDHALDWWSKNHQRTNIRIYCEKGFSLTVEPDKQEQAKYVYDRRKLKLSPLWFHKVWKRGLSGVEYKGRPHFIADLKYTPIARLEDKDMKVYKVDVVSSKSGIVSIIRDLWCVAFETEPYYNNGIAGHKQAKCIASISPELRLAEVNVSKRITSNVINNLLD